MRKIRIASMAVCALSLLGVEQRNVRAQAVTLTTRQSNGSVLLELRGPTGAAGTVRVSSDLQNWSTLQPFVLTGGMAAITDAATGARQRFYAVSETPTSTLPDLASFPNSSFTPGEGFDVVQYSPDGKLGFIFWKDGSLTLRERSNGGNWTESTVAGGGAAVDLSPRLVYSAAPAATLLYDSSSTPHVLRVNGSSIQHLKRSGGSWSVAENISTPGEISRLTAAMRNDVVHLGILSGSSLLYSSGNASWNWTTVDSVQPDPYWMPGSYSRRWFSMAVDSRGAAHFVYRPAFDFSRHPEGYMRANTKLKYASNRNGAWSQQVVREPDDISGEAGSGESIAIGPNDLPAIASWYNERGDGGSSQWSRLQFYEMDASGNWNRSEVTSRPIGYIAGDDEKGTGAYPYLRFDPQGRPHIVFTDHASQHFPYQNEYAGNVRHAVRNGSDSSSWSIDAVWSQDRPLEQQAVFPAFAVSNSELAVLVLERLTSWNTAVNPQVAASTYKLRFLTRTSN